ncbi:MAG: leucine-rich repeat domain-containing protein, partial [Bacteroidota bacterium]
MAEARVIAVALDSNALAGEIDPVAEGLDLLTSLDLSFNDISEVRDLSGLTSLQQLNLSGNRLEFGTLEALDAALSANLNYADQQEVLESVRRLLEAGNTFTIDRTVTGDNNVYRWFRDDNATEDSGPTIELSIESPADEGTYHVEVTNPGFPDLVLTSAPVIVRVSSLERDQAALLVLYDSAGGAQWTNGVNWTIQDDISLWDGVTLENNRVVTLELPNRNVTGFVPDDLTDIGGLVSVDLSGNNINRLPDLSSLSNLQSLDVSDNELDFDDLEVNMGITNFTYSDQAPFGPQNVEVKVPRGDDYELRILIGGEANEYQWSFVGEVESGVVEGAKGKKYRINDIRYENQGAYQLTVENPNVPGLVLTSYAQTVLATVDLGFEPLYRDFDNVLSLLTTGQATLMKIIAPNQPFDTLNVASLGTTGLDFTEVVTGDYLIGLRSDTLIIRGSNVGDTIQFLPTYFGDSFLWEDADTLQVRESIEGDSIIMQQRPRELTEADGDGEVSLTVESLLAELQNQNRGAKVQARRVVKRAGCSLRRRRRATGGRVENDEFELVAYKETDDQGRVTFNNLPAGTYRLTIEYPGIPMDPDSFIEFDVNEGGMEQESLTLEATVAEEGIAVELVEALGIYRRYFRNLSVYPNPVTDYLHVAYDELKVKTVVMELYDMQGQRRLSKPLERRYQGQELLDLIDLPNGMYLLRMLDTDRKQNIVTFRVLVRKP